MYMFWNGRGFWVVMIIAIAMFLPIIVLRQVDGPEIDRGVCLTMGLAAAAAFVLGLIWNRGVTFGPAAREHSFFGVPVQLWALPMALFAALLGMGVITTAEEPRNRPPVEAQRLGGAR